MDGNLNWRRSLGNYALVLGLGIVGSTVTSQAMAGCGAYSPPAAPPANWHTSAAGSWMIVPTVYSAGAAKMIRVVDGAGDSQGEAREAGIVGLWKFTMVSDGNAYPGPIPYGTVTDFGTVIWHGDGTEVTISAGRPPSSGDVCMGAWKQTGPLTYKLNHLALGWVSSDSPPAMPRAAAFAGPGVESEEVTLSRSGDRFEGTFVIDAYGPDGTTFQEHITGKVSATRITPDTKLP
jgi:hypothetical protein